VVQLENGNLAILIGSGNREDPRNALAGPVGHLDKFYMFQDSGSNTINMLDVNSMVNVTNGDEVDLSTADGWYIELGTGEKVVSNAVTLNGVTFFNTSQVVEDDNPLNCSSNLGTARAYHVSFTDGSADNPYEVIPGGGLPPSPVPVIVDLIPDNEECEVDCDDLKRKVEAIVSGTTVLTPPGSKLDVRERRYWFEEIE
jgi:type IV pilus assembly protein PilY1